MSIIELFKIMAGVQPSIDEIRQIIEKDRILFHKHYNSRSIINQVLLESDEYKKSSSSVQNSLPHRRPRLTPLTWMILVYGVPFGVIKTADQWVKEYTPEELHQRTEHMLKIIELLLEISKVGGRHVVNDPVGQYRPRGFSAIAEAKSGYTPLQLVRDKIKEINPIAGWWTGSSSHTFPTMSEEDLGGELQNEYEALRGELYKEDLNDLQKRAEGTATEDEIRTALRAEDADEAMITLIFSHDRRFGEHIRSKSYWKKKVYFENVERLILLSVSKKLLAFSKAATIHSIPSEVQEKFAKNIWSSVRVE